MAIDQDIEQRVDAYRGNPQALQKRYAANQELLDLLALQRLKSEKDDAMRKVQMEMQQNPQTIKQQKERELLEMTKQDLTDQMVGIMQNTQKRQQNNMQRVAKQGAAAPQQVQQLQSGLGALAKRQQQQGAQQAPMRRMAAGGVVALQAGGDVTQAEIAEYKRRYTGQSSRRWRGKSDAEIADMIREERSTAMGGPPDGMELTRRGFRPARASAVDTAAERAPQVETAEFEEKDETTDVMQLDGPAMQAEVTEEDVTAPSVEKESTGEEPPKPQGIMELLQAQPKLTAPKVDMAGAGSGASSLLSNAGLGSISDPEQARTTARDESATFLGRDDKRNKMNEYLEQLKAMDVRQQDPDKMRDEQISAFLRGTAGGGSFGQTMAGGSGAMATERQRQEKSERDRLLSRIGIDQTAMTMDADLAKQALSDGRSAYEQSMAHQRTAAQVMSQMRGQDLQVAIADANREFEANSNNVKNLLNAWNIQYTNDLRLTMESADRRAAAGKTLGQIQKDKVDFITEYVSNDAAVIQAENLALTSKDPIAVKAAQDARALAEQKALNLLDKAGILDTEVALRGIMDSGGAGGTMPTAPTMPNFDLSAQGRAALERNLQQ
jgi:hypothetical protein